MKTTFTARHIRLHPRLREIVQTKLAKLERVLPGRAEARIVVTGGRKDVGVEVTVAGRRGTLTATARAADQPSAAQDVMDRVAAQVGQDEHEGEGREEAHAVCGAEPRGLARRAAGRAGDDRRAPARDVFRRARCSRRTPSPPSPLRVARSSFSATRPSTTPCAFCTAAATEPSAWSSPSR